MYKDLFFLLLATVPALTSVLKDQATDICSPNEFSCGDGTCLDYSAFCDGTRDCANGADEVCAIGANDISTDAILNRSRRQTSKCHVSQWQCADGTCINFDGKCDGVIDCRDGSDETHALCRDRQCQYNWFRCTYGACVDGTAPCNGIQECADNSDELLPRCRNETEEIRGQFRCLDGRTITADKHCDGVRDCADGSDETLRTCAGKTCLSYLFQCAYGACVDQGADCNGLRECADGSDEALELCKERDVVVQPLSPGACVLPEYPEHGKYVVSGVPLARPGMSAQFISMNYTCDTGYGVLGKSDVTCNNGWWSVTPSPKCVRFCHLKKHVSVEYKCVLSDGSEGFRVCGDYEPRGTNVQPECRKPNYYHEDTLRYMTCFEDGSWNYIAKCTPGLVKNATNITVIVKDKVEVFVSSFEYAAPVPVSNSVSYDIDEADWRVGSGQAAVVRPYGEGRPVVPVRPVEETNLIWDIINNVPTSATPKVEGVYGRFPGVVPEKGDRIPVGGQGSSNPTNINFNISNSTVVVKSDPYKDKIFFRD